jgi:hypothetical protein
MVYGSVPPLIVVETAPLVPAKHNTAVGLALKVMSCGCVSVTFAEETQPLASVTVKVYVPIGKLERLVVLAPLFQE